MEPLPVFAWDKKFTGRVGSDPTQVAKLFRQHWRQHLYPWPGIMEAVEWAIEECDAEVEVDVTKQGDLPPTHFYAYYLYFPTPGAAMMWALKFGEERLER